jgi:hypothetical protein
MNADLGISIGIKITTLSLRGAERRGNRTPKEQLYMVRDCHAIARNDMICISKTVKLNNHGATRNLSAHTRPYHPASSR